jgi:hypothetical protein
MDKQCSTRLLRGKLNGAIGLLSSLFEVSGEEFASLRRPRLLRKLPLSRLDMGYQPGVPGYDFADNFFYFPIRDWRDEQTGLPVGVFSESIVQHEAGHYLHALVNPAVVKEARVSLVEGVSQSWRKGFGLREIVAEYPNLVLGTYEDCDDPCYGGAVRVFESKGPDFLPELARMSVDEAVGRGVLRV